MLTFAMDYLAILAAEFVAMVIRRNVDPGANPSFAIPDVYFYFIVPMVYIGFLLSIRGQFQSLPFWRTAQTVSKAILYATILCITVVYFSKEGEAVSRVFVALTGVFSWFFVLFGQYFFKRFLNKNQIFLIPMLVIGAGKTTERMLKSFGGDTGFGYRIIGVVEDDYDHSPVNGRLRHLGTFRQIEKIIRLTRVQDVIISVPGLPPEEQMALLMRVQPLVRNVSFIPDFIGAPVTNMKLNSLVDSQLMLLSVENNLNKTHNRIIKRIFDLTLSILGMVVILPVTVLMAAVIYIDNPGPVFFAHRRIGKDGKEFPCYKFRSMIVNAQETLQKYLAENAEAREEWERDFKLKDDPRITKVGAFIRKTSLDELPQIFNVIKGDMSLVGPRPIITDEIPKYGDYFTDFCSVKSGITGLWQVSGRSDTTYEERVQMDVWYVRNWSVWLDIQILVQTIGAVLKHDGAY